MFRSTHTNIQWRYSYVTNYNWKSLYPIRIILGIPYAKGAFGSVFVMWYQKELGPTLLNIHPSENNFNATQLWLMEKYSDKCIRGRQELIVYQFPEISLLPCPCRAIFRSDLTLVSSNGKWVFAELKRSLGSVIYGKSLDRAIICKYCHVHQYHIEYYSRSNDVQTDKVTI